MDIRSSLMDVFMVKQFQTGQVWIDCILLSIFLIIMKYDLVINVSKQIISAKNNPTKCKNIITNYNKKHQVIYIGYKYGSGYSSIKTYITYPKPIIHILDYMDSNKYSPKNKVIRKVLYCEMDDSLTNSTLKMYVPADTDGLFSEIEIYDDIYFSTTSSSIAKKDSEIFDCNMITFYITSYFHSDVYIRDFISKCQEMYDKKIEKEMSQQLIVFKHNNNKKNNSDYDDDHRRTRNSEKGICCNEYFLSTTKHLVHNCFFTAKHVIKNRIDFFVNNEEWYFKRGIPYQLTLVFQGEAGCGKTSTMKGIATYTNRHIIDVDLTLISTIEELENIFYGTVINGKTIPTHKRLFIIDEIDKYFELLKIEEEKQQTLQQADAQKKGDNIIIVDSATASRRSSVATASPSSSPSSSRITKGQILSIMDGVLESKGRFIICTANDITKIDDVFKRPGRMDEIIHFTKCDSLMILQMLDLFYNGKVELEYNTNEYEIFNNVQFKFSPSEINKLCFNNCNDREKCVQTILT